MPLTAFFMREEWLICLCIRCRPPENPAHFRLNVRPPSYAVGNATVW